MDSVNTQQQSGWDGQREHTTNNSLGGTGQREQTNNSLSGTGQREPRTKVWAGQREHTSSLSSFKGK